MSVYEKLQKVQDGLKVPKSQFNKFGNYNYRNCEDILEAFKPIGEKHKATIIISDHLEQIGDRYYIKAIVTFVDIETSEQIAVTAYAREEENKKGMDSSQVTGATSSYARKYALNGLFCIDDTKDADSMNNSQKQENKSTELQYKCEKCGKPFTEFDYKGKRYTAKQGYEIAKKNNNGIALCNACKKAGDVK